MHELSICEAILHKVETHAAGRQVTAVSVRVGHFRQVVPDALQFSWEVVTEFTSAKGARLLIEQVPAVVACTACGQQTTLHVPVLCCGVCENFDVTLVSGEELQLVSMDIEDE